MTGMNKSIIRFWAKTTHDFENLPNAYHPLICHLIDVACVAKAMWDDVLPEITKKRLAKPFGLQNDLEKAGTIIAFLAGLHDLGKCSPPFALRGKQDIGREEAIRKRLTNDSISFKQRENLIKKLQRITIYRDFFADCDCDTVNSTDAPHGFVTAIELPAILQDEFGFSRKLAVDLSIVIGGHHGIFPDEQTFTEIKKKKEKAVGEGIWKESRLEIVRQLANLFDINRSTFNFSRAAELDNATSMIFAGLTTVADWIGSNTQHRKNNRNLAGVCESRDLFIAEITDGNHLSELDLKEEYLPKSESVAATALQILGWSRWPEGKKQPPRSFDQLFPAIASSINSLQQTAIEVVTHEMSQNPGIMIIEAPMGLGKTETAMYVADYFNSILGTRGIYFALPTQATSDQMFGRIEDFLGERFRGEDVDVHLMLSHGHASLSEDFNERIAAFEDLCDISDDAEENNEARELANIVAGAWFTSKKKTTLVPLELEL